MTEAEWLACEVAMDMLIFIRQRRTMRRKSKLRKQRLFAAACCRRIWHLIAPDEFRNCVEVAEQFADGLATSEERQAAEAKASSIWYTRANDEVGFACLQVCYKSVDGLAVSTTTISAVFKQQQIKSDTLEEIGASRMRGACPPEQRAQCELLRDIFGNPFRPVSFSATWRTDTALALAHQMYESRDFSTMPILADALQDAGCDNDAVLTHCRGGSVHVRGCWVVDLILAKS